MKAAVADMRVLEESGKSRKYIALALGLTPAQVTRGLGPVRPWRFRRVQVVIDGGQYRARCSGCAGSNLRHPQRYCHSCHAKYQREHRPKHSELSDEARKKANCRAYTNVYVKRGVLPLSPCEKCGSLDVNAHHDDYTKPLQVRWMCVPCHQQHHREERSLP